MPPSRRAAPSKTAPNPPSRSRTSQHTAVSETNTATAFSAEMTVGARSPCRYVATASPANSATITRSPAAPRG